MKILLVSFDYRPKLGGVATCSFELANALNNINDVDVHVLTPKTDGDEEYDKSNNLNVTRDALPKTALWSVLPLVISIRKTVDEQKPDIIINMLWMPSGFASLVYSLFLNKYKIPYYVFAHGVEVIESTFTIKKQIRSLIAPIKKLVFKRAKMVFSVSQFTAKLLHVVCHVSKEKISVVYNGVNSQYFTKQEKDELLLKKYNITNQTVFLTITRLDDYKGVDNAILAFSKIKKDYPNFIYLVGGVGQDSPRLKELIKKNNLTKNIILCGKIPEEDIVKYYNLSDAFILLSRFDEFTPNFEGFGLVFLEAAACGIPSIAGDSGGIPDAVIDNKTGILVDPLNIEAISSSLVKLMVDKDYKSKLGRNALERAKNDMSWDKMAKRIIGSIK